MQGGRRKVRSVRARLRRARCALIAPAATLLVAGCNLGPYYHRPDVPPPAEWRTQLHVGRRADGAVEIAVADDGPGIADADKPKATERFFRGDASRGSPGVGLGLSIVDAVAKLHGGVLQLLDNHPGLRAQMVLPGG